MLLAMRRMLAADTPFPIRIGVNRGPVFTGEIGPPYRRTYVCMGDTVNLAARLMGKSRPGTIFATRGALDRSQTKFDNEQLEPFMVKGKSEPVHAFVLGELTGSARAHSTTAQKLPFVDRERERAVLGASVAPVRMGFGTLVELIGPAK